MPDAPSWDTGEHSGSHCPAFIDADGRPIPVLCCDFGVRTRIATLSKHNDMHDTTFLSIPGSAAGLVRRTRGMLCPTTPPLLHNQAWDNFRRELQQLLPILSGQSIQRTIHTISHCRNQHHPPVHTQPLVTALTRSKHCNP